MGSITFGGLVSGLDTNSIVDQLVAVEKSPITAIQTQVKNTNSQISILGDLSSKFADFSAAADDLATSVQAQPLVASSSNSSSVQATASLGATPGNYSISVDHLAQAQTNASTRFATNAPGVIGTGTLKITAGSGTPFTVSFDATKSLDDIANSINSAGIGAVASVLYDGSKYRLVLASKSTGLANKLTFVETGASLGFADPASQVVDPLDSSFTINGMAVTRASNHLSDVAPGMTFDLVSATPVGAAPTNVAVTLDVSGLSAKIQKLADSYNAISAAVSSQLTFDGTVKGADTLFGDGTMKQLQRDMGGLLSTSYSWSGGKVAPTDIGLSFAADGSLTFDTAKFTSAVGADPTIAQHFLQGDGGGTGGIITASQDLVKRYTDAGNGLITTKSSNLTSHLTSYQTEIDKITASADSLGARLHAQFAAMEQLISMYQTQSGIVANLAGSLLQASTGSSSSSSSSTSSTKTA